MPRLMKKDGRFGAGIKQTTPDQPSPRSNWRQIAGWNIYRIRHQLDWSMEKLADESGTSYMTIYRAEKGTQNLTVDKLEDIGRALGVTFARLAVLPHETVH